MDKLTLLHQSLREIDERRVRLQHYPGLSEESLERCLELCTKQALWTLEQAGPDVIAQSWGYFAVYAPDGTVAELHDYRSVPTRED